MRLSLRVDQMLLADLETFYKTPSKGRLLTKFSHQDLSSSYARPYYDVGELQQVEDISLLRV